MSIVKKRKIRRERENTGNAVRRNDGGLAAFRLSEKASEIEAVLGRAGSALSLEELYALMRDQSKNRTRSDVTAGLMRLIESGVAEETEDGSFRLSERSAWMSGTASGTRSGAVFFEPDEDAGGKSFIFGSEDAVRIFPGDRVRVAKIGADNRGRTVVSLKEVIEAGTHEVVGTVKKRGSEFWLEPSDPRVHVQIRLTGSSAIAGQGVVAEITSQPQSDGTARAQVKEILGSASDASVEVEMAARRYGLPTVFADDVLGEARALPDHVLKKDMAKRVDLRDVAFVTIDGEDARDFDDAVWCAPVKGGGWRVLVAIADVSWYVKPGSALDRSAQERATSVYFPRRVVPMLPEELSNGLCSLNPDVDRCVMVCDAVVSGKGDVTAYQFYPGLIRSHGRLTYTQVWQALQGDENARKQLGELFADIENLHALFKVLQEARKVRGAINFETRETYIRTDENGKIEAILPREHNDAHRLIEEMMLVANTCAADFIVRRKAESLFRIHEGPTEDRLETLRVLLSGFDLKLGGNASPRPADYEEVMKQVRGTPNEEAVQTALLRSMQRAVYSPELHEHFGLAYQAYTHFTSPIRRYPDLLVHRTIRGILSRRRYRPQVTADTSALLTPEFEPKKTGKRPLQQPASAEGGAWQTLGRLCSAAERRADEASFDVVAWLKCTYIRDYIGQKFSGKITGVTPAGLYVTLDDLFIEGFIHISALGWDFYIYDSDKGVLEGSASGEVLRLGGSIGIIVSGVDIETRRIEFTRQNQGRRGGSLRKKNWDWW